MYKACYVAYGADDGEISGRGNEILNGRFLDSIYERRDAYCWPGFEIVPSVYSRTRAVEPVVAVERDNFSASIIQPRILVSLA